MKSEELSIDIKTSNNNFIIVGKECEKIRIVSPLTSCLSNTFVKADGIARLSVFDCIANFHEGDKNYILYRDSFNLFSNTTKIEIPKDMIVNLRISAENSKIFIKDIIFETINITDVKGKVKIKDSHVDLMTIDGIAPNISLIDLSGSKFDVHTGTGIIWLKGQIANDTSLTTEIGTISVNVLEEEKKNISTDIEVKNLPHIVAKETKEKHLKVKNLHGKFYNNLF